MVIILDNGVHPEPAILSPIRLTQIDIGRRFGLLMTGKVPVLLKTGKVLVLLKTGKVPLLLKTGKMPVLRKTGKMPVLH